MKWKKEILPNGEEAIAPEIISASRATDIPAFYSEWFFNRLKVGYVEWVNPFNGKSQLVSFSNARLIVFWTKNPKPIIPYLIELDRRKINYYFLFTLNNYDNEGYEVNLPNINERISIFKELSEFIGREKVIWRFDPILLTDKVNSTILLERFRNIGESLKNLTRRMIFSFAEIDGYKKVKRNLVDKEINYQIPSEEEKFEVVSQISKLCKEWGITPFACTQNEDYSKFDVKPSRCIDGELISQLFKHDKLFMDFLQPRCKQKTLFDSSYSHIKDKGQRQNCGCIKSKDIGMYNTCLHLCVYCYANSSNKAVRRNFKNHNPRNSKIIS